MQVLRDARPLVLQGAFLLQQLAAGAGAFVFSTMRTAPATEASSPSDASPMNHRACQKCGNTTNARLAPASFHVPPLLQAMTRNRYWPGGT